MQFSGIDVASERHTIASVDEQGKVLCKATTFEESSEGYAKLRALLGPPEGVLVAMEATGHYWQNLFAWLSAEGYAAVLLNPLRTNRFAGEDLRRGKTDEIDALTIARFAQQKRPAPTTLPSEAVLELRELVRLRDRFVQDLGDRVRQLHRTVDLAFPEFTSLVRELSSELATALLSRWPTASAFREAKVRQIAAVRYDGRHLVGDDLAGQLVEAAGRSVGRHHGAAYRAQAKYACEDIDTLRDRIRVVERDISQNIDKHDLGRLYMSIGGIGEATAARLVAELGDDIVGRFRDGDALCAHVGVVPGLRQSGKSKPSHAPLCPIGHAKLRAKLWMPTLAAIRHNIWVRTFYERLIAGGKPRKLAVTACLRKLLLAVYAVAKSRQPFIPRLPAAQEVPA